MKRIFWLAIYCFFLNTATVLAVDPLEHWKPAFDPATAQYTYLLSSVGHPAIEGVAVGFHIRDRVWQESKGQLYVDYRPISQLGGEKDVLRKLKLGAIQGMLCSSVAAPNISPRLGLVNLPFLIGSFEQLESFRNNQSLFAEYGAEAEKTGIKVLDFTGYGGYGWATNQPVTSLKDARRQVFRIAEAPVNIDLYRAWGLQFTVMPWPDVPQALQTGVISALDHTPIVCNISKKFTVAKHFTRIDYAQGLYIHLMNKRWLESLPGELQSLLLRIIAEESAVARAKTRQQQQAEIAKATAAGVTFGALPESDLELLKKQAEPVIEKWSEKIGKDYLQRVRAAL